MKLPKDIIGENKVRDAMIINLWEQGFSAEEIIAKCNLKIGVRRIEQILYVNRALVKIDREWEETRQIYRIRNHIRKSGPSKKDVLDWETLLDNKISPKRVEHIGERGETKIIIIRPGENKQDGNTAETPTISRQISI